MTDEGWPVDGIVRRSRVITDNDYGGDPDGLIELAHQLLSPSVDVRAVIGSHLRRGWDPSPRAAVAAARSVLELTGRADVPVLRGSDGGLADHHTPAASDGVDAIVAEAIRDDVEVPLFVTCGAGLTALASAWLTERRIGSRLTLIWIGGSEHARPCRAAARRGSPRVQPGHRSDRRPGRVQPLRHRHLAGAPQRLPHRARITCRAARPDASVWPAGATPLRRARRRSPMAARHGIHLGETYILGDSPLVLLTALQSSFHPDPASSTFVVTPCPRILDSGEYGPAPTVGPSACTEPSTPACCSPTSTPSWRSTPADGRRATRRCPSRRPDAAPRAPRRADRPIGRDRHRLRPAIPQSAWEWPVFGRRRR